MNKILAIKGHSTRGAEVIELLGMMGGLNNDIHVGTSTSHIYFINGYGDIGKQFIENNVSTMRYWQIFTLEEFLEKYPFKVGDLVDRNIDYVSCIIDDMRWNSEKCCVEYHLNYLNGSEYGWHVSDCLIKPENVDAIIGTKIESTGFMQMGKTVSVIFNSANYEDEVELQLGDYEIAVRDGKTYAVRKKPKYPKTYKECCEIVNACPTIGISYDSNEDMLYNDEVDLTLLALRKLLICLNAYQKIAGEEMGLGKPWEPDWNEETNKFTISNKCNKIYLNNTAWYAEVLSFPTAEMRNTFYENFKDLIEQCKELL